MSVELDPNRGPLTLHHDSKFMIYMHLKKKSHKWEKVVTSLLCAVTVLSCIFSSQFHSKAFFFYI